MPAGIPGRGVERGAGAPPDQRGVRGPNSKATSTPEAAAGRRANGRVDSTQPVGADNRQPLDFNLPESVQKPAVQNSIAKGNDYGDDAPHDKPRRDEALGSPTGRGVDPPIEPPIDRLSKESPDPQNPLGRFRTRVDALLAKHEEFVDYLNDGAKGVKLEAEMPDGKKLSINATWVPGAGKEPERRLFISEKGTGTFDGIEPDDHGIVRRYSVDVLGAGADMAKSFLFDPDGSIDQKATSTFLDIKAAEDDDTVALGERVTMDDIEKVFALAETAKRETVSLQSVLSEIRLYSSPDHDPVRAEKKTMVFARAVTKYAEAHADDDYVRGWRVHNKKGITEYTFDGYLTEAQRPVFSVQSKRFEAGGETNVRLECGVNDGRFEATQEETKIDIFLPETPEGQVLRIAREPIITRIPLSMGTAEKIRNFLEEPIYND